MYTSIDSIGTISAPLRGALIKTTLVDYPSRIAAAYFVSGCNIRCPYCYNSELVFNSLPQEDSVSLDEVYSHLEKRKNVLTGFVLSGGEPLIHTQTAEIIKTVKSMGYVVKLDTNGLYPERLEALFDSTETRPDYVAVDLKTRMSQYKLLHYNYDAKEKLTHTIEVLKTLGTDNVEFRTVLCPPLITNDDIQDLAQLIDTDAQWFFANFRNDNCLDPRYNYVTPYSEKQVTDLVQFAKSLVVKSILR